jgi:hypothetical protein
MHAQAEMPASQRMPSALWRGVTRIALVCAADINASLCKALLHQAQARTSLPVELASADNDIRTANRGLIVLTVALEEGADRHLTAVARRAVEIDDAEGSIRRTSAWPTTATVSQVADQLLGAILPPRSRNAHARQPDRSARLRPPSPPRGD